MRVHNLMLDLVGQKVEEFCHSQESPDLDISLTDACKLDVVCYVLNRVRPMYVVSGRGLAHLENKDYTERNQQLADIVTLISEAVQTVTQNKRCRDDTTTTVFDTQGHWFNFPNIIGHLFHGMDFSPVSGVSVQLLENGHLMKVINPSWQNPYEMVPHTAGTFLFWPHPIRAELAGEKRGFPLEIRVEKPGFDPLRYGFEIHLVAEGQFLDFASTSTSHRLKDLYLFPAE